MADVEITVDQASAIARKAWNEHQMACRITTVSGSLEKVAIALRAAFLGEAIDGVGNWQRPEAAPFDRQLLAVWWGSQLHTETGLITRDSASGFWIDDQRCVFAAPDLWMPWPELPPHPELAPEVEAHHG
jgi:hypothetical protein